MQERALNALALLQQKRAIDLTRQRSDITRRDPDRCEMRFPCGHRIADLLDLLTCLIHLQAKQGVL